MIHRPLVDVEDFIIPCEEGELMSKMPEDPWKHRSSKMVCRTCIWYVVKTASDVAEVGRCRRHAPTLGGYPAVFPNDWCGDHKVDETKI